MRELYANEVSLISGGINCIDADIYNSLHNQAKFSGGLTGVAGALVVGAIAFGLTMPPAAAAVGVTAYIAPALAASVSGLAVFPWLAMYGYGKSSVWAPYFPAKN